MQVQATLPAIGLQLGPYGECNFDPSALLKQSWVPEQLESRFANVTNCASMEKRTLEKELAPILTVPGGLEAQVDRDPYTLRDKLGSSASSLNKRIDAVINKTLVL